MIAKSKIFVALAFVFTLLFSSTTAFAGTGGSTNSVTINVSTGGSGLFKPYIVLNQNKAKASFRKFNKDVEGTAYGHYQVVVNKDGRQVNSFKWTNGSTKIKLDKNANYTINISYIAGNPLLEYSSGIYHFNHWIEQPQWRVSKESKIENCW